MTVILGGSAVAGVLTIVNPFLPLGIVLSGLAFWWAIRRPGQALLLLLYILPLGTFLKRLQYIFLPASEVWIVNNPVTFVPEALFYGVAVGAILTAIRNPRLLRSNGLARWLDFAVVSFLLVAFLGCFRPELSPVAGLLGFRSGYIFPAAYFVASILIREGRLSLRQLTSALVVPGLLVALYGIKQYFFGLFPFEEAWLESGGDGAGQLQVTYLGHVRTFSTLGSPAGYYLLVPFLVAWSASLWQPRGFPRHWMVAASIVMGLEIVLSTAKSAILLMVLGTLEAAGLALTHAVWSLPAMLTLLAAAVTSVGTVVADALSKLLPDRAIAESVRLAANPANAPSLLGRVDQISQAFEVLKHNPIGVGLASTGGVLVLGEASQARIADNTLETYYGRIAAELGIPGILLIGLLVSCCIVMAAVMFRRARAPEAQYAASCFLLAAVAGAMSGIGWEVLGIKESGIVFWFLMGWMRSEWAAPQSGEPSRNDRATSRAAIKCVPRRWKRWPLRIRREAVAATLLVYFQATTRKLFSIQ